MCRRIIIALLALAQVSVASSEEVDVGAIVNRLRDDQHRSTREADLVRLRTAVLKQSLGQHETVVIAECARLMAGRNHAVQEKAADVLSFMDLDALSTVVQLLKNQDPLVQARAARVVGTMAVRHKSQLSEFDDAISALNNIVQGSDANARNNAVFAIARLGPQSIDSMVSALALDGGRQQIMKGLVRHARKSVEPLCDALETSNQIQLANVAYSLFHLSWRSPEAVPGIERHGLKRLIGLIDHSNAEARDYSIQTLGRMGSRAASAVDPMLALLERKDPPYNVIASAVERIGAKLEHVDKLFAGAKRMIDGGGYRGHANAFGSAIATAGEPAIGKIIEALKDESVHDIAMYALFEMGPSAGKASPFVIQAMQKGDRLAPEVLANIGDPKVIPLMVQQLKKDRVVFPRISVPQHAGYHRSYTAAAVARFGIGAIPGVLRGLDDADEMVRAGCLSALALVPAQPDLTIEKLMAMCRAKRLPENSRGLAFAALRHQAGSRPNALVLLEQLSDDVVAGSGAQAHIQWVKEAIRREQKASPKNNN